jgi:hypothetical protein
LRPSSRSTPHGPSSCGSCGSVGLSSPWAGGRHARLTVAMMTAFSGCWVLLATGVQLQLGAELALCAYPLSSCRCSRADGNTIHCYAQPHYAPRWMPSVPSSGSGSSSGPVSSYSCWSSVSNSPLTGTEMYVVCL